MMERERDALPTPSRRGARVGLVVGVALAVGFAALLGIRVKQAMGRRDAVATDRATAAEKAKVRDPLPTVVPQRMTWLPRVDVTGTLKPWREADVGFETGGRLVRVEVAVGDRVTQNQLLAVLDASRAVAQVGQAESQTRASEANLAMARDHLKRTEALVATHAVPEAQAEQARQQVALAEAQLQGAVAGTRLAKTGAGQSSIAAPFPGIVTRAPTGIGSVVNPGVALLHIEDNARFRLSATVSEEDVPLVTVGSTVKVLYREQVVDGRVIAVVPSLDQATRRAPVEIEVPNNGKLLAWSFVRARIRGTGETDAVRLPALARRAGSQDEVVKVESGAGETKIARITKVSFAVDEDGSLIVQRGLTVNDRVLLSPSPELKDGEAIVTTGN